MACHALGLLRHAIWGCKHRKGLTLGCCPASQHFQLVKDVRPSTKTSVGQPRTRDEQPRQAAGGAFTEQAQLRGRRARPACCADS